MQHRVLLKKFSTQSVVVIVVAQDRRREDKDN
jgi:hypothetical protein